MLTAPHAQALVLRCPRCGHAPLATVDGGLECPACQSTFPVIDGIPSLLPDKIDEDVRRHYEVGAIERHQLAQADGYRYSRQQHIMIAAVHQVVGDLPPQSCILDVGCGQGAFSRDYAPTHTVVGVDFALGMLRTARQNGLVPYHAEATHLPLADDQFDVCLCTEVIQYLADVRPFLREMSRTCRMGGRVIISTLYEHSLVRRAFRLAMRLGLLSSDRPLLRAPRALTVHAAEASLTLRSVTWTHFPLSYLHVTRGPTYALAGLASNFIVEFEKVGPSFDES